MVQAIVGNHVQNQCIDEVFYHTHWWSGLHSYCVHRFEQHEDSVDCELYPKKSSAANTIIDKAEWRAILNL